MKQESECVEQLRKDGQFSANLHWPIDAFYTGHRRARSTPVCWDTDGAHRRMRRQVPGPVSDPQHVSVPTDAVASKCPLMYIGRVDVYPTTGQLSTDPSGFWLQDCYRKWAFATESLILRRRRRRRPNRRTRRRPCYTTDPVAVSLLPCFQRSHSCAELCLRVDAGVDAAPTCFLLPRRRGVVGEYFLPIGSACFTPYSTRTRTRT